MDERLLIAIEGGTRLNPELGGHIVEEAAEHKRRIVTELTGLLEGKVFRIDRPYPIIGNMLVVCVATGMPALLAGMTEVVLHVGNIGKNQNRLGGIRIALVSDGVTEIRWLDQFGRASWSIVNPREFSFELPDPSNTLT